MSDDRDPRPRLSRYNSVAPSTTQVRPTYAGSQVFIPTPSGPAGMASRNASDYVPKGYRYVGARPGGILVEAVGGPSGPPPPVMGPSVQESERWIAAKQTYDSALRGWTSRHLTSDVQTLNGVQVDGGQATEDQTAAINNAADVNSIFGPLGIDSQIDPNAQFVFDRGAPLRDLGTGERANPLLARGIMPITNVLNLAQAKIAGEEIGSNTNMMTVGAVIKWFRGLSVRDKGAYNKLVVMLRNAGYLNGKDEELPMGGYTTDAGVALARAANDLSQANDAGDERTMMEYLNDRGKAFADYLAQEEADQAKAEEYQPVDRQYQDPASLRAAAYDAARAAIGRKLTDEEEARLQAAFRAKENATFDQVDEAGRAETSFAVEAPDVSGQIDDFLQGDEFDVERKKVLIGDYANEFMRMMGVSG